MRRAGKALAAVLGVAATFPLSAQAAVTSTTITTPASPHHLVDDDDAPGSVMLRVAGTADGADGDALEARCYTALATDGTPNFLDVADGITVADGRFEFTVPARRIANEPCRLRVVPAGLAGSAEPEAFAAVTLFVGSKHLAGSARVVPDGPNAGKRFDFYAWFEQARGSWDFRSIGACGLYDGWARDPSTLRRSQPLWYCNGGLMERAWGPGDDRAAAVVDGANAFLPAAARQLYPRSASSTFDGSLDANGFQPLALHEVSQDPVTGDALIRTEEPLVRCEGDVSSGEETRTTCPRFVSAGVAIRRDIVQTRDGRTATLRDTLVSTDGQPHDVDLWFYESVMDRSAAEAAWNFPWADGDDFNVRNAGATVAAPGTRIGSVYGKLASTADPGFDNPAGSITFSTRPDGFRFVTDYEFELRYLRRVPAQGGVPIDRTYATGLSLADVRAAAAEAEAQFAAPGVELTGPGSVVRTSSDVATVTGRVTARGGARSLTVDGTAVDVAGDGTFSHPVRLRRGPNTITAVVTDHNGDATQAQRTVTYEPPADPYPRRPEPPVLTTPGPPAVTPPPPASAASASLRTPKYARGAFTARLTCAGAPGTFCTGSLEATTKVKAARRRARRSATRTLRLARATFRIPAGQTRTVRARMTRKARATLRAKRRLKVTLALRQKVDGKTTVTRRTLTVRAPRKHR